jgi:hypothetical protein
MSLLVQTSTLPGALEVVDTDDPLALRVTESTSPGALRVRQSTRPGALRVRGLFSPSQLPGLAAWYDASDSSTVLTQVGGGTNFASASSQFLSVADNSSLDVSTAATWAGWIKTSTASVNHAIINKAAGSQLSFIFELFNGGTARIFITKNGDLSVYKDYRSAATNYNSDAWVHLAATFNAGTLKLYANGVELTGSALTKNVDGAVDSIFNGTAALEVGRRAGAEYGNFSSDEISMWSRELSGAEITWLYNSGAGRTYAEAPDSLKTNLVSWWSMNAPATGDWLDQHGTNHLTPSVSRPTATTGVTFNVAQDGQTVRRWLDKSGNGRHLDQATLAAQPILTATGSPNGKPRITFNGEGVGFTMTSFTPTTVALAASGTGGTNVRLADSQMIVLSGTNWVLGRGADGTWSGMNTTVNYNSTPACFQLTTNNASIRAGGQFFQDTATSEMPAITALPAITPWTGGWSELIMLTSELSDSDWLKLERYLLRRNYV